MIKQIEEKKAAGSSGLIDGMLIRARLERVFTNWDASGYKKTNYNGWYFERYWEDEGYAPDYDTRAMPKK